MNQPLRAIFIDMDGFFASIEQHLQPHLRGKPVGVAPMLSEFTCCIATSYEAKAFGVNTGTMVTEARRLCPGIHIVEARPARYVDLHHQIVDLVESCIHIDHVLSIDEMLCCLPSNLRDVEKVELIAAEIKSKLTEKFSKAVTCSIGVAPNGWLAKIASKMRKPDGFHVIESDQLPQALYHLSLQDLHGIGKNMALRLHACNIHTVEELCDTPKDVLYRVWNGVEGKRLWHKLRGEPMDSYSSGEPKKSIGHGHVLPPEFRHPDQAIAVAHRLLQKAATRMRQLGLYTGGFLLNLRFSNRESWTHVVNFAETSDSLFLAKVMKSSWRSRPDTKIYIHRINITLINLVSATQFTPSLFDLQNGKNDTLYKTLDNINSRFGKNALYLGGCHEAINITKSKIAFNHIPDKLTLRIENR
jgi:DNA polymerase IV